MKQTENDYPYPVLINGSIDYNDDCRFETTATIKKDLMSPDDDYFRIPIVYELVCNGLKSVIDNKKACVIVKVTCSNTSYSEIFKFKDGETATILLIPKKSVARRITLRGSIIATEDIQLSCPGEIDETIFSADSFPVGKGEILATDEAEKSLDIDTSPVQGDVFNVFQVLCDPTIEPEQIDIDFTQNTIFVRVNKNQHRLYKDLDDYYSGLLERVLISLVVIPALVEVLALMRKIDSEPDDAITELKWYKVINKALNKAGINLSDHKQSLTSVADRLFKGVTADSLSDLLNTLKSESSTAELETNGED